MSNIMEQRSGTHALPILVVEPEAVGQPPGQVAGAKAVFEPAVPSPGIHQVREGELLHASQALEGRRVHHLPLAWCQFD